MNILKKKIVLIPLIIIIGIAILFFVASSGLKEMKSLNIETVELGEIPDGSYTGNFKEYRWDCTVLVTVSDHLITDVKITAGNVQMSEDMLSELKLKVISKQSPDVDAVSGATVSCKAFLKAVENALRSAL